MTGTALTEEDEFREIYKLDVIEIPTNKPVIRIDHPDVVFKTEKGKFNAVIEQVIECHKRSSLSSLVQFPLRSQSIFQDC